LTIGTPPENKKGNSTRTVGMSGIGANITDSGPGPGASSFIQFDLSDKEGGVDINKNRERPIFIGLAHELAHGLINMFGLNDNTEVAREIPMPGGQAQRVSITEIATRFFENLIRYEQGEAPRVIVPTQSDY
jgi:hypothetical protein